MQMIADFISLFLFLSSISLSWFSKIIIYQSNETKFGLINTTTMVSKVIFGALKSLDLRFKDFKYYRKVRLG